MTLSELAAAMLEAARAAGAAEVRVRVGYYVPILRASSSPLRSADIAPGMRVAKMGCPDCVSIVVVADGDLSGDWEVAS